MTRIERIDADCRDRLAVAALQHVARPARRQAARRRVPRQQDFRRFKRDRLIAAERYPFRNERAVESDRLGAVARDDGGKLRSQIRAVVRDAEYGRAFSKPAARDGEGDGLRVLAESKVRDGAAT